MGGLGVLLSIVAYVAIATAVVRAIKSRKWRIVAIVVAILLPTADAVVGRLYLRHLCATEAGLETFKVVEGVEGFFNNRFRPHAEWIVRYGYQFIEGNYYDGKPMRLSLTGQGKLIEERNVVPRSTYRLEYSDHRSPLGFGRAEWAIRDVRSAETLARHVTFDYAGGWAERFLGAFSDAGGSFAGECFSGAERISVTRFVTQTLKPKQSQ